MGQEARQAAADDETKRRLALGRLLPLWPQEIADATVAGQQRICRLLAAALRRERQRGVAGHWGYDVSRHAALVRALRPELRRLSRMQGAVAPVRMPRSPALAEAVAGAR